MTPQRENELLQRINYLQNELNSIRNEVMLDRQQNINVAQQQMQNQQPQYIPYQVPKAVENTAQPMYNNQPKPTKPMSANKELNEVGVGKVVMGIGAVLLILIAISLFAIAVMPLLTNSIKAIFLVIFSLGLFVFGNRVSVKTKWGIIPEGIGLVGLYLTVVISNVVLNVISLNAVYFCIAAWIGFTCFLTIRRNFVFGIIEQLGLFCSACLICGNIANSYSDYMKAITAIPFALIMLMFEFGLVFLLLRKQDFKHIATVYIGNALMLSVFVYNIAEWGKGIVYYYFGLGCVLSIIAFLLVQSKAIKSLIQTKEQGIFMLIYTLVLYFGQSVLIGNMDETYNAIVKVVLAIMAFVLNLSLLYVYQKREDRNIVLYSVIQGLMTLFTFFILFIENVGIHEVPNFEIAVGISTIGMFAFLYFVRLKDGIVFHKYYALGYAVAFMIFRNSSQLLFIVLSLIMFVSLVVDLIISCKEEKSKLYNTIAHISLIVCIAAITYMFRDMLWKIYGTTKEYRELVMWLGCLFVVLLNCFERKVKYFAHDSVRYILSGLLLVFFYVESLFQHNVWFWLYAFTVLLIQLTLNTKDLLIADKQKKIPFGGAVVGIKYTLFCWYILKDTSVSIIVSIVFLLCAVACIFIGMCYRYKSMRLYGLVLAICSILKLILIDFEYNGLATRAVGFLIAGLICLGMSFMYSKYDKKLSVEEQNNA